MSHRSARLTYFRCAGTATHVHIHIQSLKIHSVTHKKKTPETLTHCGPR